MDFKEEKEIEKTKDRTKDIVGDTSIEVKKADDPEGGKDSGIPGTNERNIGTERAGAGLGGNKGMGTAKQNAGNK